MRNFFSFLLIMLKQVNAFIKSLLKILPDRRTHNFFLLFLFLFLINYLIKKYSLDFFSFHWINLIGLFLGYGVIFFWDQKQDFLHGIFKSCIFFLTLKTITFYHIYSIFIIFYLILFINKITDGKLNSFFDRHVCLSPLVYKFILYLSIYNLLEVLFVYGWGFKILVFIGLFLSSFVTLL